MSSSDENGTKEPTNESQELSVNGPGQKNSDKTSNELPNVKGEDKMTITGQLKSSITNKTTTTENTTIPKERKITMI